MFFMLLVALISMGSYHNRDLAVLLTPPSGCPAPCFLGVRPGITRFAGAVQLLDSNPALQYTLYGQNRIDWWWRGRRIYGSIYLAGDVVRYMAIYDIPLGEVWLSLGQPDGSQLLGQTATAAGGNVLSIPVMHSLFYAGYDIRVDAPAVCASFWQEPTRIYIAPPEAQAFAITSTGEIGVQRRRSCEKARQFGHRLKVAAGTFLNLPVDLIK